MSGRLAAKFCHVVLTQWKHLESDGRTRYHGQSFDICHRWRTIAVRPDDDVVDNIAPGLDEPIFGQIGETSRIPQNFEAVKFLSPQNSTQNFSEARVVIGHAGIARSSQRSNCASRTADVPSRRLREHRNDHQLATANSFVTFRAYTFSKTLKGWLHCSSKQISDLRRACVFEQGATYRLSQERDHALTQRERKYASD